MSTLDLSNVPSRVTLENASEEKKKVFLARTNSTCVLDSGNSLKVKAKDSQELLSYLNQEQEGVKVSYEEISGGGSGDVPADVQQQLNSKLDKVTSSSANPKLYGISEDGIQTTYFATQTPNANTIPLRDASGRFQVADGVAPKQAVNMSQLTALSTNLNESLQSLAALQEQNTFTDLNTFKESTQFDKGLNSDDVITVTNSIIKVMSDTDGRDHVAQYQSDSIVLDENGNTYILTLPKKSGTLATLADVTGGEVDISGKLDKLAESVVNQVYARTQDGDNGLSYSYQAEGSTIAQRSPSGTLAVEDPTQEKDAANKKFVEEKCAKIPSGVEITNIPGATNGVVADDDYLKLTSNPNEYIIKEGKKYDRSSDRSTEDSYTYVHNGYLNNREIQEAIEITVSSKSWVLNADKLLTDKTIANGKIGGVSIKSDFSDGLEISQTDGNLSIYGAVDADIAGRASKRPITPTNLNKAVLAALTDNNKIMPSGDQQTAFKAAWGFTESQLNPGIEVLDLVEISVNATNDATSGTISEDYWDNITADGIIGIKFNNEYYLTSDDEHTPGVKSFTHIGWNGSANQTKSINITLETKAWTLKVGYSKYYRHYIQLTVDGDKSIYYDFPSSHSTAYTGTTLPAQPDSSTSQFTLLTGGYYSSVNGQIYRDSEGTLKAIVHGLYTTNGTTVSYLSLLGVAASFVKDDVVEV